MTSSSALRVSFAAAPAAFTAETLRELPLEAERRRQDVAVGHQHHQLRLDVDGLVVLLEGDVVARVQLALVEDAVFSNALMTSGLSASP